MSDLKGHFGINQGPFLPGTPARANIRFCRRSGVRAKIGAGQLFQ